MATTVSARIAGVAVAAHYYSTANHGAQNRSDYCARARATVHAAIVTTRRRTVRIGYGGGLRTWRHRSRVVGDGLRRYRLRLGLRDSSRRCGLDDLRRGLRSRLVVSDAS